MGPPSYADATSFELYDLQTIMQIVTTWCRTHCLQWSLTQFDGSYTCEVMVYGAEPSPSEIVQFSDHDAAYEAFAPCVDACYVLLGACVRARRSVPRIIKYYDSLTN